MRTLILGVGNYLLRDEGVGLHVIRALERERLPNDVEMLDGGTGGLHLLQWLMGYDRLIMIDATLDDNPPGAVCVIQPRYAADFPPLMSAHEIGLRDMLAAMTLTDGVLPDIRLILVSVANIQEIGSDLSPAVAAAIPQVIATIKRQLELQPVSA